MWDKLLQIVEEKQRPIGATLCLVLLFVCLFVESVSADKLWVLASLVGVYWTGRTADKLIKGRLPTPPPPPPES